MMKKILSIIVMLMMITINVEAVGIREHPTVAVMQFTDKAIKSKVEGILGQDFTSATEYAIVQLDAAKWFDLVDYEQMTAIARMLNMYQSGLFDQTAAPIMGRYVAAQYVLVGSLTGMTLKESGALGMKKQTVSANVTVRLVDVETLKIVGSGMGSGSSSATKSEITFKPYRNANRKIEIKEEDKNKNVNEAGEIATDDKSFGTYYIVIEGKEVSATLVRNALGKAVRDAIYGDSGIITNLNGGIKLNVKTDF